jgi:DNA-directed RNA polymerase sigma subunit (sigma70/sigma32)
MSNAVIERVPDSKIYRADDDDIPSSQVDLILSKMDKRQAFVIRKIVFSDWTQLAVARYLKVSRTRVREIKKQAFNNFKKISKELNFKY